MAIRVKLLDRYIDVYPSGGCTLEQGLKWN